MKTGLSANIDFLVDVTFECHDREIAKMVGQSVLKEEHTLTIDQEKSAHTVSGYLFMMELRGLVG